MTGYAKGPRVSAGDVPAGTDRFVRDRFVVTGDVSAVTARFAAFGALGADGVVLAGALDGVLERLDDLATAVRAGLHTAKERP